MPSIASKYSSLVVFSDWSARRHTFLVVDGFGCFLGVETMPCSSGCIGFPIFVSLVVTPATVVVGAQNAWRGHAAVRVLGVSAARGHNLFLGAALANATNSAELTFRNSRQHQGARLNDFPHGSFQNDSHRLSRRFLFPEFPLPPGTFASNASVFAMRWQTQQCRQSKHFGTHQEARRIDFSQSSFHNYSPWLRGDVLVRSF